jgi:hypothetical protein
MFEPYQKGVFKISCRRGFLHIHGKLTVTLLLS